MNNDTPHLKSPMNQYRKAALGWPAIKLQGRGGGGGGGGLQLVCGRPTLSINHITAKTPIDRSYFHKHIFPFRFIKGSSHSKVGGVH